MSVSEAVTKNKIRINKIRMTQLIIRNTRNCNIVILLPNGFLIFQLF